MMAEDLLLNSENDLDLVTDLQFTDINTRITQRIKVRFQWFWEEWYLNTEVGIKYFENIFRKNPNKNTVDDTFKAVITEDKEIDFLEAYRGNFNTLNPELRKYLVTFSAISIYGDKVEFSEGVVING